MSDRQRLTAGLILLPTQKGLAARVADYDAGNREFFRETDPAQDDGFDTRAGNE